MAVRSSRSAPSSARNWASAGARARETVRQGGENAGLRERPGEGEQGADTCPCASPAGAAAHGRASLEASCGARVARMIGSASRAICRTRQRAPPTAPRKSWALGWGLGRDLRQAEDGPLLRLRVGHCDSQDGPPRYCCYNSKCWMPICCSRRWRPCSGLPPGSKRTHLTTRVKIARS
jgi:hypothetical protein